MKEMKINDIKSEDKQRGIANIIECAPKYRRKFL